MKIILRGANWDILDSQQNPKIQLNHENSGNSVYTWGCVTSSAMTSSQLKNIRFKISTSLFVHILLIRSDCRVALRTEVRTVTIQQKKILYLHL